jgi:hypothetical protein
VKKRDLYHKGISLTKAKRNGNHHSSLHCDVDCDATPPGSHRMALDSGMFVACAWRSSEKPSENLSRVWPH